MATLSYADRRISALTCGARPIRTCRSSILWERGISVTVILATKALKRATKSSQSQLLRRDSRGGGVIIAVFFPSILQAPFPLLVRGCRCCHRLLILPLFLLLLFLLLLLPCPIGSRGHPARGRRALKSPPFRPALFLEETASSLEMCPTISSNPAPG